MSEWVCLGWWNSGFGFPLRVSGFTGPTQRERASQTCLMISLTCGIGKHPFSLEILSQWPSGRPRNLSLLMYCCCGLGQMLQVVLSLGTPNPKGISFCLLEHYLHGSYKHLKIPQDWQSLSTAPSLPEILCIMLDCNRRRSCIFLPQLTSLWGSVDLNHAPESFQSHISPHTTTLYEGASVPAKWMNDGTNSNMAKQASQAVVKNRSIS